MNENKLLSSLLPSHPDFQLILQNIREKYNIPEISPDDEPISEIYFGEEIIPLERFRTDIEKPLRENLSFLPPNLLNSLYQRHLQFITLINVLSNINCCHYH